MGKRKSKNEAKKSKVSLVFDEAKRKEFLCGFRKRKLERKQKAQEELQRMLKEEKKRIKQENKESYKKLIVSSRPIPDIEQLLQDEYEDEDVNVKIVELSTDTLQKKDLVIGENRPKENHVKVENKKLKQVQGLPGMGSDEESEEPGESDKEEDGDDKLKTKKDIKRILKKQATTKIQKSKVFQMKSKLDRVKNKKKSMQKKGHMGQSNKGKSEQKKKGKSNPHKEKGKKKVGKRKH